jgi:hypothetical protein
MTAPLLDCFSVTQYLELNFLYLTFLTPSKTNKILKEQLVTGLWRNEILPYLSLRPDLLRLQLSCTKGSNNIRL